MPMYLVNARGRPGYGVSELVKSAEAALEKCRELSLRGMPIVFVLDGRGREVSFDQLKAAATKPSGAEQSP